MAMALGEAILVCLTGGPLSGYDLARTFDTSIGFFWRADHQQIYRELRRLKAAGQVEDQHVVQRGRPNKNLWTLTEVGLRRIEDWSREDSDPSPIKDDLLVKLYALGHVDRSRLRAQISARRDHHAARLELYERILRVHYQPLRPRDADQAGKYLGLALGLRYERGWIEWCREALAVLSELSDAAPAEETLSG
jgi:DNA-binding PadR family transcriptional regulator